MRKISLMILSCLLISKAFGQIDTINNCYFANLKKELQSDSNIKDIKLVQDKIQNGKGFIQSMIVQYKNDSKYWRVGKEFIYFLDNSKLGYVSTVDKNNVLIDTTFSYNANGTIASMEIFNIKYDYVIPYKKAHNFFGIISNKYNEKMPNKYKAIEYTCDGDTIIEKTYKYIETIENKGFVVDGDVFYYNKEKKLIKRVYYDMGLEKHFANVDSSRLVQFIDKRDGQIYPTIKIGEQTWFAKNMAYKPDSGQYWIYRDDKDNIMKYGYLYNWETSKNVCPIGSHLPTKEEYETLIQFVGNGDSKLAYRELLPSGNSGFSAIYTGCRLSNGDWSINNNGVAMWSSTNKNRYSAWAIDFSEYNPPVGLNGHITKKIGLAVRCIVDK